MNLYVRVGSDGALEQFASIEAAAVYLNTLSVGKPTWWRLHGFDTQNYHGRDHVSMGPLGKADQLYLEQELEEAEL